MNEIKGKTFSQFVTDTVLREANASLNKQTYTEMNPHWRPSNALCAWCNINYKYISKTETFNEDRKRIMEILSFEDMEEEERLNVYGGDTIEDSTKEFLQTLTKDAKAALLELYKYDFLHM